MLSTTVNGLRRVSSVRRPRFSDESARAAADTVDISTNHGRWGAESNDCPLVPPGQPKPNNSNSILSRSKRRYAELYRLLFRGAYARSMERAPACCFLVYSSLRHAQRDGDHNERIRSEARLNSSDLQLIIHARPQTLVDLPKCPTRNAARFATCPFAVVPFPSRRYQSSAADCNSSLTDRRL